jgi:nucleoid-associated protein YgaU
MKWITLFLFAGACLTTSSLRAQDAAIEERLNQLNGLVQDLLEDKAAQRKQVEGLAREIASLREQQNQPNTTYAMQEDLKHLAEKVQEIDRKREADRELILKEMGKLAKSLAAAPPKRPKATAPDPSPSPTAEKGFEYIIQSGDTLSAIATAYGEQNIKVTTKQILQANPGLDEKRLRVGQKIFIPAPKP